MLLQPFMLHAGLMDEAEVEEVIHLVERQKKKLHFAGSLMHVQPACQELRQMPLFQGLSDQDFAKVHSHLLTHYCWGCSACEMLVASRLWRLPVASCVRMCSGARLQWPCARSQIH